MSRPLRYNPNDVQEVRVVIETPEERAEKRRREARAIRIALKWVAPITTIFATGGIRLILLAGSESVRPLSSSEVFGLIVGIIWLLSSILLTIYYPRSAFGNVACAVIFILLLLLVPSIFGLSSLDEFALNRGTVNPDRPKSIQSEGANQACEKIACGKGKVVLANLSDARLTCECEDGKGFVRTCEEVACVSGKPTLVNMSDSMVCICR